MKLAARKWHNPLIEHLLLVVLIGLFSPVSAQESTRTELNAHIRRIAQQVQSAQTQQDQLLRKNRVLTDKINEAKQHLQKGGNPLIELQLQNDLKASRVLADQIQTLDQQIYGRTEESIALKQRLVSVLDTEIDALSKKALATRDAKLRKQQLERVMALQREKETCQAQIATESNALLLGLEITLGETDGPDEILQKLAILSDQQDLIQAKIKQLDAQIQEAQKKVSLRGNMLELLRDLRRGEEDEFDLDRSLRIAELQEEIADIEATLEIMRAKLQSWRMRGQVIAEKTKQFSQEAEKLTRPGPEGESPDGK